ncbi:MAG: sulfotransferase, partial [Candidatus Paceibacteria bacterium]
MNEDNVIYIISQPRSGSSLLQSLIASHTRVKTLPEPWIMLILTFGINNTKIIEADFNADFARKAFQEFISTISHGERYYQNIINKSALSIYGKALKGSKEDMFLDKGTRYYHIIPELLDVMPNAKYVFLLRNPIAVFASILETNMDGSWGNMFNTSDRCHDIFTGPHRLAEAVELYKGKENVAITHYESLVRQPEVELKEICNRIGIEYEESMIGYEKFSASQDTSFIDPKSLHEHKRPVDDYIKGWKRTLDTHNKIQIGHRYVDHLGSGLINNLGYDYTDIKSELNGIEKKDAIFSNELWRYLLK